MSVNDFNSAVRVCITCLLIYNSCLRMNTVAYLIKLNYLRFITHYRWNSI
jgi:hypothetical protein